MKSARALADHARDLAGLHADVMESQRRLTESQVELAEARQRLFRRERELEDREERQAANDPVLVEREARRAMGEDVESADLTRGVDPARLRAAKALAAEIIRCGKIRRGEVEPALRPARSKAEVLARMICDAAAKARGEKP